MVNLAKITTLAKFFLNSKIINRFSFDVETQNGLKNEPMFDAIKVVRVDDSGDVRNDKSFLHEHVGEQLFFHFDGFWNFF